MRTVTHLKNMIHWQALGLVLLNIVMSAFAVFAISLDLIMATPRVCTRCAARAKAAVQGKQLFFAFTGVFTFAVALASTATNFNSTTGITFSFGLAFFAGLLGAGQPVCGTCGGRTLVPTSSPAGKELLRDYHHSKSGERSSSTLMEQG